jgi:hypothetical protein
MTKAIVMLGVAGLAAVYFGAAAAQTPPGKLMKQPSVDVQKPTPLPVMGTYVRDRVSVADPSMEISAASILKPQKAERVVPAPFTPWNLPDPFEHAETIRLREPLPENTELPVFVAPLTRR